MKLQMRGPDRDTRLLQLRRKGGWGIQRVMLAAVASLGLFDVSMHAWGAGQFTLIEPPPGQVWTSAGAMSADGSVIAGTYGPVSPPDPYRGDTLAFRWTSGGGTQVIPNGAVNPWLQVATMSRDGRYIGGTAGWWPWYYNHDNGVAVNAPGGIGSPGAQTGMIVRFVQGGFPALGARESSGWKPYYWTGDAAIGAAPVALPTPPGYPFGGTSGGISVDGTVLYSWVSATASSTIKKPVRWVVNSTSGSGTVEEIPFPSGFIGAAFSCCSANGELAAGWLDGAGGVTAPFYWTQATGSVQISVAGSYNATVSTYSSGTDALVANLSGIGGSYAGYGSRSVIRNLNSIASTIWAMDLGSWVLTGVAGISDDGKIIAGTAKNTATNQYRAFRLTAPDTVFNTLQGARDPGTGDFALDWQGKGWILESSPDLGVTVPWSTVTTGVTHYQAPMIGTRMFYRLRMPD